MRIVAINRSSRLPFRLFMLLLIYSYHPPARLLSFCVSCPSSVYLLFLPLTFSWFCGAQAVADSLTLLPAACSMIATHTHNGSDSGCPPSFFLKRDRICRAYCVRHVSCIDLTDFGAFSAAVNHLHDHTYPLEYCPVVTTHRCHPAHLTDTWASWQC